MKFTLDIAYHWWLEELTSLLNQPLQVVTGIRFFLSRLFLFSSSVFFGLSFLFSLVPADCHTYTPSLKLLCTCLSQDDFGNGWVFNAEKILRILAPAGILTNLPFLSASTLLFYLNAS